MRSDGTPTLSNVRVLLVEDDFLILMALESAFAAAGAEIAGLCRNAKEALAAVEDREMEAAVLDFRIGGETTVSVARKLAQRGIPFVFVTGQTENEPIFAEWPNCKVIAKPAPMEAVLATVASLVQRQA
jgi:DNA-binding response OmpR family regulator